MPKTTHDKTKRLILFFTGSILALIVAELIVRLMNPQLTLGRAQFFSFPCFEQGEYRWIKLASNKTCLLRSVVGDFPDTIVTTNSLGLRNAEIDTVKSPNTKRILFIGDSFTMGWGVKENDAFPRVTEQLLHTASPSASVETINAGFAAAGPSGYYLYLKLHGLQLSPDVIVVGFYLGNDLISRRDVEWVKTDANGLPLEIRSKTMYIDERGNMRNTTLPIQYRIPILRDSHLFILLVNTLFSKAPSEMDINASKNFIYAPVCQYKSTCHELDREKEEVMKLFRGMKTLADSHNAKLLVLMIPTDYQVYDEGWNKYGLPFPLLHSDRSFPDRQFGEWFTQAGIDYLDLLPTFMNHQNEETYFTTDDHWNPLGHQVAAEAVADYLKRLQL